MPKEKQEKFVWKDGDFVFKPLSQVRKEHEKSKASLKQERASIHPSSWQHKYDL